MNAQIRAAERKRDLNAARVQGRICNQGKTINFAIIEVEKFVRLQKSEK